MNYLLEANVPSVSERNNDNRLAIHLLFECGEEILDRDSCCCLWLPDRSSYEGGLVVV